MEARNSYIALLFLIGVVAGAGPVGVAAPQQRLDATVDRVIDGITIEVSRDGRAETVRYLGVRVPFGHGTAHDWVKSENQRLVAGRRVTLSFDTEERDEQGLLLAHVYVGTQLVSAELLRRGYAEVAPARLSPARQQEFAALEKEARASRRGLWLLEAKGGRGGPVDGGGSPDDNAMPMFPWPPPQWTSRVPVPADVLPRRPGDRLGDLFDRITAALTRGGIEEWSAYSIGADGFAVAARLEHIRDDWTPFPGNERWSIQPARTGRFTLAEYLKALFTAETGRFRVIVVVATTKSIVPDPKKDPDLAQRWPSTGALQLSPSLRTKPVPPTLEVAALVYEFYRPSSHEAPVVVQPADGRIPARQHLIGAGLWKAEEWK